METQEFQPLWRNYLARGDSVEQCGIRCYVYDLVLFFGTRINHEKRYAAPRSETSSGDHRTGAGFFFLRADDIQLFCRSRLEALDFLP